MKRLLNRIQLEDDLVLAGKMFIIFLLIIFSRISHHYFFGVVALIIFFALIKKEFISNPSFWLIVSSLFLPIIWIGYNYRGNHVFLILYISILFFIATHFSKFSKQIAIINAKAILGIIMFFAVIQKLFTKDFMNGSSLSYLNNTGGFFTHFQRFFPKNQEIINENLQLIKEQTSSIENLTTTIELSPIHWIVDFDTSIFVSLILIVEALFFVLIFVKNQYLRNGFFSIFVISLIFTRTETGFASLLCILLFLQAQKDHVIFKLIYLGIYSVFISLILTRLGAH